MRRILTILCLTTWGTIEAQSAHGPTHVPVERFPVGETLVYDAKFGFLTVGKGLMQVVGVDTIRGAPTLHTVFRLKGGALFYRLDDRMDSWFGVEDFASRRFVQDFHEGGSHRYTRYEIYPDSGFYRQFDTAAASAEPDTTAPTSPDPLDDTAFFYFARAAELEVDRRYTFDRYFRPDRNPVILEVVGRDTLDVPAGRFPTIIVRPLIKGRGILAESQNPRLWLSDDERRLVVQMKSTFGGIGTITLALRQIGGKVPAELTEQ
jgi:hypothetical protein